SSALVTQIQGRVLASTAPADGQFIGWNASQSRWEPQTVPTSGGTSLPTQTNNSGRVLATDGSNLFWSGLGGDITGQLFGATVAAIQNHTVAATTPTAGQFLGWNNLLNRWEPQTPPSGGGGFPNTVGNSGKVLGTDGS